MAQDYISPFAAALSALIPDASTVCPVTLSVMLNQEMLKCNFCGCWFWFDTHLHGFASSALMFCDAAASQFVLISCRKLLHCSARPKTWLRPSTMLGDAVIMALEPLRTRQRLFTGIPRCALGQAHHWHTYAACSSLHALCQSWHCCRGKHLLSLLRWQQASLHYCCQTLLLFACSCLHGVCSIPCLRSGVHDAE